MLHGTHQHKITWAWGGNIPSHCGRTRENGMVQMLHQPSAWDGDTASTKSLWSYAEWKPSRAITLDYRQLGGQCKSVSEWLIYQLQAVGLGTTGNIPTSGSMYMYLPQKGLALIHYDLPQLEIQMEPLSDAPSLDQTFIPIHDLRSEIQ